MLNPTTLQKPPQLSKENWNWKKEFVAFKISTANFSYYIHKQTCSKSLLPIHLKGENAVGTNIDVVGCICLKFCGFADKQKFEIDCSGLLALVCNTIGMIYFSNLINISIWVQEGSSVIVSDAVMFNGTVESVGIVGNMNFNTATIIYKNVYCVIRTNRS